MIFLAFLLALWEIQRLNSKAGRWIASAAIRQLESDTIQSKLRR
jgi:hypothetical protein